MKSLIFVAMKEMKRERETWVDWAKMGLIWLVVCGHVGLPEGLMNCVCSFYMPAFFLISGYLYRPHPWWRSLRNLVGPVMVGVAVNAVFYALVGLYPGWHGARLGVGSLLGMWQCVRDGSAMLFPGFWFILTWAVCRVVLDLIHNSQFIIHNWAHWVILVTCVAWMCLEPFIGVTKEVRDVYLYRCVAALPMMILGMELRRWNVLQRLREDPFWKYGESTFIGLCLCFVVGYKAGEIDMWCGSYGMNFGLFFILSSFISMLLFVGLMSLPRNGVVETLSTGTLFILGTHYVLREVLLIGLSKVGITDLAWWQSMLLAAVILLLLVPAVRWCQRRAPWILGK